MSPLPTDHTVVVSALHRPRTLQRIVTTVAGRGFFVEDLRYTGSSASGRALVTLMVDDHVASRDLEHLCHSVGRAPDVLWARPLAVAVAEPVPQERFRLDRYDVSTRATRSGPQRVEAVVAGVVDGARHLGAGEGEEPVAALVDAFRALLAPALNPARVRLAVTDRWSRTGEKGHAFAYASVEGTGLHRDLVCVDRDELGAAAAALSSAASVAVEAILDGTQSRVRTRGHRGQLVGV